MPINVFDGVDKSFLTLAVIIALTGILYRVMGKYNRPMVMGGLVAVTSTYQRLILILIAVAKLAAWESYCL